MKLDAFLSERANDWDEAERLLQKSKGRLRKLPADEVLAAMDLYRSISTDLVILRQEQVAGIIIARVTTIVRQMYRMLYKTRRSSTSLSNFFANTYWRRIAERPAILLLSLALMILPAAAILPWTISNPAQAAQFLPEQFRLAPEDSDRPANGGFGEESLADRTALSTEIFLNNIRVAFLAFAGGMTLGIFTTYIYLFNAFMVGIFIGLGAVSHDLARLFSLIAPHGVLELSCIAVAAYAGYRIAWSFIHPGMQTRRRSLTKEARAAGELALGTAACLIIAGFIEGLITPADIGFTAKYVIGIGAGAVYWSLVIFRGRRAPSRRGSSESRSEAAWLQTPGLLSPPSLSKG